MPLGSAAHITVYDRVVVGSDGTPTSLYAVDRAAEVAQAAAGSGSIVVTAYDDGDPDAADDGAAEGVHRKCTAAEAALQRLGEVGHRADQETTTSGTSMQRLSRATRRRRCSTRPAPTPRTSSSSATVASGPSEGQLLGSVPAEVVKNAVCDVLIVQTSALDEDRLHEDRLFTDGRTTADDPGTVTRLMKQLD